MPARAEARAAVPPAPPGPLRPRVRAALRLIGQDTGVVVGSVIALNLLRVVSSIILTRLLAPDVFGAVGVVSSAMFVIAMVTDLGFQAFVIRHRDGADPRFLDAIWTVRLLRAVALTLLLVVLAGPTAALLEKPALAALIAVAAGHFLIDGFSSLSLVTALRDRLLLRLSMLEFAVAVVQLAISVALALAWRDAWAVIAAMLVASAVKTWASYALFPGTRRRWRLDRGYSAELWGFARFVTGSSIISMVLLQADKLVLSRLFTLDQLGLYVLAGNLALAPLAFTTAYASRVLYPLYARVWREQPGKLAETYYAARRRGSLLYMVGAGGLIGVAPLLVAILYDDRYAGAALYLRLLAIAPLLALGSAAANEALTASGHVRATLRASLAKLGWLATIGPLAFVELGPIGLVAAVGTMELATLAYSWLALHRIGLFQAGEELRLLAAGMAGIVAGIAVNGLLLPVFAT